MKRSMKLLAAALAGTIALSGCAKSSDKQASSAETTIAETESSKEASAASTETSEESADQSSNASENNENASGAAVRVGSLKGPTSMGLAELMDRAEKGETENDYTFTMPEKPMNWLVLWQTATWILF